MANSVNSEKDVVRTIGESVDRQEDLGLVTGQARYTNDFDESQLLYAAIHRSQHGHARIADIDTSEAERHDDVVAVYTAADTQDIDGTGMVPSWFEAPTAADNPVYSLNEGFHVPNRPILADGVVRYTGEPIAVVVARETDAAHRGAESIDVEYKKRSAITSPSAGLEDDAVRLHEDIPNNLAVDWEAGSASETDDAFEQSDNQVELDIDIPRVIPQPMEPRGVIADYRQSDDELTVRMSTQVPHHVRTYLSNCLGIGENQIRVVAPEVGGGFGLKSKLYPAEAIISWCSMKQSQPVKWISSREESYHAGIHGRPHETTAEMAFQDDGNIIGLRIRTYADVGAYVSKVAKRILTIAYGGMVSGAYEIPAIHCHITGVFTNGAPVDAYRGAGRPQATYVVERLVDTAASELEMDPVEIRRKNFIPPENFPYKSPVGPVYDTGDYETALEKALKLTDYESIRNRQDIESNSDTVLGVGIASLVEETGVPVMEGTRVRFHQSGGVTAYIGTVDHGQGHITTFSQILSEYLGVPYEDIEIKDRDTERTPEGNGTFASRSLLAGGNSLVKSTEKVIDKAKRIAANQLEAPVEDVTFDSGDFQIRGAPNRSVHIQDIAKQAHAGQVPDEMEPGLEDNSYYTPEESFPFGTHVAVVEVNKKSGEIDLQRYIAVQDCGNQINPTIVEGQVHGGVAQGIGQALYEEAIYDQTASLVTDSMNTYGVPHAKQIPDITVDSTVTPTDHNPLGVKGIGENGALGPPAAIVNAVVDALGPATDHIDMPLTPEKVWQHLDATD